MENISGIVEKITYLDEESGYGVIKIISRDYPNLVTLTGKFFSINIGTLIEATGNFTVNKKFGRQFDVINYKESLPKNVRGIEKYLGSGLFEGIGPKFAKQIVSKFKEKTISIIQNEPTRLLEIPNIGVKRVEAIKESWNRHKNIKDLMVFLGEFGASNSVAQKIYKAYGDKSIEKLRQNPYSMIEDVYGIGFKIADTIAQNLGHSKQSYSRCKSGIFYVLNELAVEGSCCVSLKDLVERSSKLLDVPDYIIIMTFNGLKENKELIYEKDMDAIYLPYLYYCEIGIAKRVYDIFKSKIEIEDVKLKDIIKDVELKNKIIYDKTQITAIKTAISSKFSLITGGPGVGKTTITKAIINVFEFLGKKVILTAPTGRAAKRMAETCEIKSKTIHRLLESSHNGSFNKNEKNRLSGDVIIIDECSMIDTSLMYSLLKALPNEIIVIMIGDADQLHSVGSGNILNDIIDSGVVPVIKLGKIYRQAESSKIVTNSHRVNLGLMPDLSNKGNSDFFFIKEDRPENIVSTIKELCYKRLPCTYKVDKRLDVQILSPMKRGLLGTENLNMELQSVLNGSRLFIKRGANKYKLGDRVMQVRNNYNKNVFNGDIGTINEINIDENSLIVNFDGNLVKYDYSELEELVLSYAITIHKSQGGEFPIVLIPIHFQNKIMLQRNLLYTGITRAKRIVVLIGSIGALSYAVKNNNTGNRRTLLKEKLIKKFK